MYRNNLVRALVLFSMLSPAINVDARQMVLPGHVAKENINEVNRQVRWHTNLNSALGEANREKKMVLWIHMIGKVDGAT